jgi:hypothetical protein
MWQSEEVGCGVSERVTRALLVACRECNAWGKCCRSAARPKTSASTPGFPSRNANDKAGPSHFLRRQQHRTPTELSEARGTGGACACQFGCADEGSVGCVVCDAGSPAAGRVVCDVSVAGSDGCAGCWAIPGNEITKRVLTIPFMVRMTLVSVCSRPASRALRIP